MAIIAIYSVKGGVGKTTMAVDFAWRCAAIGGMRTLLWDLDPQGGAGYLLGEEAPRIGRAVSVFQRDGRPRELIRQTAQDNLSILMADESLRTLPVQLARIGNRRRLASIVSALRSDYRRIVLDCPPGANEVSEQVIAAADVIVVPLPPSPLSARALAQVREELTRNGRHPPILPVLSLYDSRRRHHRDMREGEAAGWPTVPQSSLVEQMAIRRQPLPQFAPASEPARALGRLWSAVEMRLSTRAAA